MKYPSVTIVMISYNDEKIIEECFKSIKKQDYPGKVNILIVDGGSTDHTLDIAKKYNVKIILKPQYKDAPHIRGEIAVNSVKSDIVIFFSADNRFKELDCLKKMMEPFFDKEIVAVETFRYGYNNNDSLLTKYFALIGGNDPIAVALGKADRSPYDEDKWHSFGKAENIKNYFKVTFDNDISKIPTLGMNGFAIRNKLLQKFKFNNSLHIEMCSNLIRRGYNKFGFVKNAHIIHSIDTSLIEFLKRRLKWKKLYSEGNNIKRTYLVYNPKKDKLKLFLLIISSITIVFPLLRAIKGFIKKQELAWFLHPLVLNIFIFNYGLDLIRQDIKGNKLKLSR